MANDFIGAQLENVLGQIDRGDLSTAATVLNGLTQSAPDDARIYFVGASLARKTGNTAKCIEALERALDLAPTWVDAHVERIRAMSQHGELQLAVDASSEALTLCGDNLPLLEIAAAAADRAGNVSTQLDFLERALALAPTRIDILNALGVAAKIPGDLDRAEGYFQRARNLSPSSVIAIIGLSSIAVARGDTATAVRDLELAATLVPNDPMIEFNLAAARGETPPSMPAVMTASLFDNYAARYDRHMVGELKYAVPRRFAEAILERYPDRVVDVLDLGSGTGLVGAYLGQIKGVLIGVELSSNMIAEAAKHGLYGRFHQVNLVDALASTPESQYDVITAADVLIYVGDLLTVIPDAYKVLRPGGVFMFSCELAQADEPDLVLRSTQRYAHTEASVRAMCEAAGFTPVRIESCDLRHEGGVPLPGFLCFAERPR